jgi:ribosomal protein S18 acetylase RimI-like enzyme
VLRAAHHDIKPSPMTTLLKRIPHVARARNVAPHCPWRRDEVLPDFHIRRQIDILPVCPIVTFLGDMAGLLLQQGIPWMTPLTIRPARTDEYDEIARVWMNSWASTGLEQTSNFLLAKLRARIPLEVEKGWSLFVADDGDALAAMLALHLPDLYLDQLFVAPEYQGRNLGRRLLAFTRQQLPDEIYLRCVRENEKAWRWYEREGFAFEREQVEPMTGFVMKYYRWMREGATR